MLKEAVAAIAAAEPLIAVQRQAEGEPIAMVKGMHVPDVLGICHRRTARCIRHPISTILTIMESSICVPSYGYMCIRVPSAGQDSGYTATLTGTTTM